MEVRLYVGNLPYTSTEEELSALFAQAGTVQSVTLIKDRDTGRSKGFAFVEMASQAEAQKAIDQFHGTKLKERDITVNVARPREERDSRSRFNPDGGRGGGRGGRSRFDNKRGDHGGYSR